ncbi:MAG: FxLYD domain-containing protein [Anaerolineae bacterium]
MLLLILMLSLAAACRPTEETSPEQAPAGFARYEHVTGVFSLSIPPDWVVSDTSDPFAVNVEFSPPGFGESLIGVYAVERAALGAEIDPALDLSAFDLERLSEYHIATFYDPDAYIEIERTPQPDGSLRISFLLEGAARSSQHNDFLHIAGPYYLALRVRLPDDPDLLQAARVIVNSLAINTDSAWASSTTGAGGAGPEAVGIVDLNEFVGRSSTFEIVGQVQNNANAPLEFVRITAQLYDERGSLLVEQDEFVSSDLVQPGERAPFALSFPDGLPQGTVRYDLLASARYADFTSQSFYGPTNFAVSSEAAFDDSGLLVVSGQVRNEGSAPARLVKVIVTSFDDEGRVVGTETTLVDRQQLAQGEVTDYTVTFVALGGNPNTFLVTAQGIIDEN